MFLFLAISVFVNENHTVSYYMQLLFETVQCKSFSLAFELSPTHMHTNKCSHFMD